MTKAEREVWKKERIKATEAFFAEVKAMPEYEQAKKEIACERASALLLTEARKRAKLTQKQVAQSMGISQGTFSRMERGNITIDNFFDCLAICGYGLKLDKLHEPFDHVSK